MIYSVDASPTSAAIRGELRSGKSWQTSSIGVEIYKAHALHNIITMLTFYIILQAWTHTSYSWFIYFRDDCLAVFINCTSPLKAASCRLLSSVYVHMQHVVNCRTYIHTYRYREKEPITYTPVSSISDKCGNSWRVT